MSDSGTHVQNRHSAVLGFASALRFYYFFLSCVVFAASHTQELLAYYTVSQSAILIYLAVMTGLLTCLAWKVSEEELAQRQAAESGLKAQYPRAFELRERMILEHGRPGSRWEGRRE